MSLLLVGLHSTDLISVSFVVMIEQSICYESLATFFFASQLCYILINVKVDLLINIILYSQLLKLIFKINTSTALEYMY